MGRGRLTAALFVATALAVLIEPDIGVCAGDEPPSAAKLLQESDRARGSLQTGITWAIEVDSVENDERTENRYIVKARGNDAYVEALAPARVKGQTYLFNDRTIWYYKPGLRSPVSLSTRQRLTGQAANGDIASTNYARDYDGRIVGHDKVGGEDTYKLELKAKASNVTYDRIRYWVSVSRTQAVKAEFLTAKGTVFKSATFAYGNKVSVEGVEYDFVSRMTITDAAFPKNVTVITYSSIRAEKHRESLFNVNNLVR
jgi:hypothetical protein